MWSPYLPNVRATRTGASPNPAITAVLAASNKPLEHVNSEHIGNGKFFFARKKQRPDRLARTAQQKHRGKSCQRQLVDIPKMRFAEVFLENLPAQRAESVTPVDRDDRKDAGRYGFAPLHSVKQLRAAEVGQMNPLDL